MPSYDSVEISENENDENYKIIKCYNQKTHRILRKSQFSSIFILLIFLLIGQQFHEINGTNSNLNNSSSFDDEEYLYWNRIPKRIKRAAIYQNEFAVYVPDGWEAADDIASKHGFTNMGQVSLFLFYVCYFSRQFVIFFNLQLNLSA